MIAIKRDCLRRDELQSVIAGRMEPSDFDSALSHLDDCDTCRAAAENLQQDGDWIIQSLSADDAADPLQTETACQVALWRMMETPGIAGAGHIELGQMELGHVDAAIPREMLGPYRFIRALGMGGMGTVYLAEHERLRRQCAIKLLPRERVDQPGWLDRFDREMTTVASLQHPNVVQATDAGQEDGWHYLVMEYLDGMDVGRIANRMDTIEVADACEIVRQAALGLAHVHASGLVHRDVKPSNLMLTTQGTVKLLDLGLVLSGDDPLAIDDRLTTVGHLMGTMPYMAPEQLADSREVDPRADIYALGATLYRLIAGTPPHPSRQGLAAHVLAITTEDAPSLDTVRPDVDANVVALVREMLSRDPSQRPQTAGEVAERLEAVGSGSGLKRLLRQALRRRGDAEHPATFSASLAAQDRVPPGRGIRKFLAAAFAGILLIVAGFTIKIQTDVGDLVVRSEHDGFVVKIKQGDRLVERLEIHASGDNRIRLHKGTYVVDVEGDADGLTLSQDVVTIERGEETPIDVRLAELATVDPTNVTENQLLYQGEDLESWMALLTREQDPAALGNAMIAVETLTRGSKRRKLAAEATMRTARRWGGIVSSGINETNRFGGVTNPSHRYMAYLLEVYPAYMPEDGIGAIDIELEHGTVQSRMASMWLLQNYLTSNQKSRGVPMGKATIWPAPWVQKFEQEGRLDGLQAHLGTAIEALLKLGTEERYAAKSGQDASLTLQLLANKPIHDLPWLTAHVRRQVDQAKEKFDDAKPISFTNQFSGGFGGTDMNSWKLSDELVRACVQLHAAGAYDPPWDLVAASILHPNFHWSKEAGPSFDAVVDNADDVNVVMVGPIGTRLRTIDKYTTFTAEDPTGTKTFPLAGLGIEDSVWSKALPLYAEKCEDIPAALELLGKLHKRLEGNKDADLKTIDAAIATLEARAKSRR